MKKVFLVTLNFQDNSEYESMDFETNIAVFTDEEKANDFCKNNSDNEDYELLTIRTICKPSGEEVIDPDDPYVKYYYNNGTFWFNVEELDLIE